MDIISHGLWGGLAVGQKSRRSFWLSFFCGIAPDLFSFGLFSAMSILGFASGPDWSGGPPDMKIIPNYVFQLYNVTHSLITFAVVFCILWAIFKKPIYELLAWPIHILFDIPTHSTAFFPTPFLWPLVEYRVDGVPWSHPFIFFPNWILLILLYLYFFVYKKRKKAKTEYEKNS